MQSRFQGEKHKTDIKQASKMPVPIQLHDLASAPVILSIISAILSAPGIDINCKKGAWLIWKMCNEVTEGSINLAKWNAKSKKLYPWLFMFSGVRFFYFDFAIFKEALALYGNCKVLFESNEK